MEPNDLINSLKECKAIKFGRFVLTSGAVSDYYIDIKKASTDPIVLKKIVLAMKEYTKGYDIIAGMELGAVPLIVALSLETNIPFVIIRKDRRDHGTNKQVEGGSLKDKKVLIIEDVTTSGGSILKTINIITENEGIVDRAVVVVDRETGAREKIKKLDVELIPLVTVSKILNK